MRARKRQILPAHNLDVGHIHREEVKEAVIQQMLERVAHAGKQIRDSNLPKHEKWCDALILATWLEAAARNQIRDGSTGGGAAWEAAAGWESAPQFVAAREELLLVPQYLRRSNPRRAARRINRRQEAHQDSRRRYPHAIHPAWFERHEA